MLRKLSLFRSTLTMVTSTFAVLSLFLAGSAYWVASESHDQLQRSSAAHQVHAKYLQLSLETYRLFKQLVDAVLSEEEAVSEEAQEQAIHRNLERLRALHAAEIAIAEEGDKAVEQEELFFLARIEAQIQKVLGELHRASLLRATGRLNEAQRHLIDTLERSIDIEFVALVREATEREHAQVEDAEQSADALIQHYSRVTEATALLLLSVAAAFILLARRRLWQPLFGLTNATQRLARGDLAYRIPVTGNDEFAAIGHEFNSMASALLKQRQELEAAKLELENKVRERTENLRIANERLHKVDQHRRHFFADISHELRTPLTLIKGESQIALRGADKTSKEYQEALERISEQAGKLNRLVDELLFIARTNDGAVHMQMEFLALDRLLQHASEDANLVGREQNVRIRFENHTPGLKLSGDKEKLRQLFMILLVNAIRYSNPDGDVTLTLHEDLGAAIVMVNDEGIGIPEDEIHNVFDRFYRGSNAQDSNTEGLGLGLPFARAIVLAHKGNIEVESELGKGTTLTVSLPLVSKSHSVA